MSRAVNRKSESRSGSWKRTALIMLCVFLALVLTVLVGVTIWVETLLGSIGSLNPNQGMSQEEIDAYLNATDSYENFTGEVLSGDDVTMPEGSAELIGNGDHIVNILLVGQDRRGGTANGHSDAMILCTVNTKAKTLVMTSFMRDMWVKIPGKYNERLNVAYILGGFDLLDETLKYNFGVVVDYNVEVDFKAFEKVVDILGGVEVELTSAEANYLNRRGNWDVDNSTAHSWQLTEGKNLLSGSQALAYSRIRAVGGDGDFGRTGRQRKVLGELLEQAKQMSVGQMISAANTVIPLLSTDMDSTQIISYIRQFAPMLSGMKVINQRVPADGAWQLVMIDGKSVIKVDFEASRKMLIETIGG